VPFLPESIYSGFLNFDPILYFTCALIAKILEYYVIIQPMLHLRIA